MAARCNGTCVQVSTMSACSLVVLMLFVYASRPSDAPTARPDDSDRRVGHELQLTAPMSESAQRGFRHQQH